MDVPVSWTNYLGVEDMATVVNHTAGGYLFYKSPEHHRITRFRPNGVPMDRPGHYIYLRDDETGDYWSVSWQPCGGDIEAYRCRHGLSYSVYECAGHGINAAQTLFIPRGENVELWELTLENTGGQTRVLSAWSYAEFSYHQIPIDNQNFQMSLYCAGSGCEDGIIDYELFYEHAHQFMAASFDPDGFDCLRDSFLGPYRTETNPLAVERGECFSSFEKGNNHCAVLQKKLTLAPGEKVRLTWTLGEGGLEEGRRVRAKYSDPAAVDAAFADLADFWDKKLSKLQVSTPDADMDVMLNTWTLYQSEINVMFSRFASFIEVGGRTGLLRRDGGLCRRRRGDNIRAFKEDPGLLRRAGGGTRHLQRPAGGLERLPEPGRRRERHGVLPPRLGPGSLCGRGPRPGPGDGRPTLRGPVTETCERELWDGEWYLRGITADGRKIGTHTDDEGRVHLESNVWAVLSGAAQGQRAVKAMDAIDEYLYTDYGLRLNAPSYQADSRFRYVVLCFSEDPENMSIIVPSSSAGLLSSRQVRDQWRDDLPAVLELAAGLDTSVGFLQRDGEVYLVRNLMDSDYQPIGVLIAGFGAYPWLLGAMGVSLLLLLMFTFRFFRREISRPIDALMAGASDIREGGLGRQIDCQTGSRKFEHLTDSFNRMSAQLQTQFNRLYQEELARRDAQIKALQAHINPHFLNNTLESINWQARMNGDAKASKMIEALSTVLDAALDRKGMPEVRLSEEMTYVNAYLYIVSQRFGERLTVDIDLPAELMGCKVPRLILQPVIENAVEHGVGSGGQGRIALRGYRRGAFLILEIENDGGLTPADAGHIARLLSPTTTWPGNRRATSASPT